MPRRSTFWKSRAWTSRRASSRSIRQRDTPEALRISPPTCIPRLIGLTGSEEQVKAAANAYKTYYKKQEAEDEFYLVDHSTFTYLMLPGSGFVDFFRRDAHGREDGRERRLFSRGRAGRPN